MGYAYVENGVVKQTLRVDPAGLFAPGYASQFIPADDAVQVGYTYADGVFTAPAPVSLVPSVVSPRQIRQALTAAGLRASVEAAVAASDQDTKDWYEFSTAFERAHPAVIAMGIALGVSADALDDLWIAAGAL